MKKTLVYCDVCEKEIKPGYGVDRGNLRLVGRATKETVELTTTDYRDICYSCTLELFTLVEKLVEKTRAQNKGNA